SGGAGFQPDDASPPIRDHHHGPEGSHGLHWNADTRHWRGGPDEYHAGLGHPAHPRNRGAEGAGRNPALHSHPVPGRGSHHYFYGRLIGSSTRIRSFVVGRKTHVIQRSCEKWPGGRYSPDHRSGDPYRRHADSFDGRTRKRNDPGSPRLATGSDRSL